ncbi:MAG: type II toxin-antitoxin system RelE/ParE family toxin [Sphingomonadales bacterium]|nr:MAG: type II toxin-antitoxin system RelE/ParE family toxin [Sphingomonadales bacterium]
MLRLVWTLPARADLREINSWLLEHRAPAIALRTIISVRARALFIERFPHGGRPGADGVRVLRVHATPYLILYRIQRDTVEVLRIRHEREDWLVAR